MLRTRSRMILQEALNQNSTLHTQALALKFQVSERTIRNDLQEIEVFLAAHSFPPLHKTKSGFRVEAQNGSFEELRLLAGSADQVMSLLSPEERLLFMLNDFVTAQGFLTLDQQAEHVDVSKSTAAKDLESLKNKLNKENVTIISGVNGSRLTGKESAIRLAVIDFLLANLGREARIEAIELFLNQDAILKNQVYMKLFQPQNRAVVAKALEIIQALLPKRLSDDDYLMLAGNLSVQLQRIALGFRVSEIDSEMNTYVLSYKIADEISRLYEQNRGLILGESEKRHICRILEGAAYKALSFGDRVNRAEIQIVSCYIAQNVFCKVGHNFLNDNVLLCGLSNEILTILLKEKLKVPLKNPILEAIQSQNTALYASICDSLTPLETLLLRKATSDEAGCIATHFLDAIERAKITHGKKMNVLVLCGESETLAQMMSNRIAAQFDVNILDCAGYGEAKKKLAEGGVDFIVSTLDTDYGAAPCLKVSHLLTEADMKRLKACLPARVMDETLLEEIGAVIGRFCEIKDKPSLTQALYGVLGIGNMAEYSANRMPTLRRVLCAENVLLDYPAKNWNEAVHKAGELLYEGGYIHIGGIEAIEKNMRELKENSVVSEGIAMAHSKSYEYTRKVGIAMVRLREPVKLLETGVEINLIFALAALDNKQHLVALSKLAQVLNDPKKLKKIATIKEKQLILNTFWNDN